MTRMKYGLRWIGVWCGLFSSLARSGEPLGPTEAEPGQGRVVIVQDPQATEAFQPRGDRVVAMLCRGLTNLTGTASLAAAWRAFVSPQDVVGIKVYATPGPRSGTRPHVVEAVIVGLLAAGVPPHNIVIWDKHRAELRRAGYFELATRFGVRVEGSQAAGYDEAVAYESPLLGQVMYGDLEFGRKGEGMGRKSYVTKLVTSQLTKIISINALVHHNTMGVASGLHALALSSVDNTHRFESYPERLADAVPEIYALLKPEERVALNIVDALLCQYEGEQTSLLHYANALNEIWLSKDPVALDVLAWEEMQRQRKAAGLSAGRGNPALFENAALMAQGVADLNKIEVERLR
jgi:uncharacterized protein (DUF362 family)